MASNDSEVHPVDIVEGVLSRAADVLAADDALLLEARVRPRDTSLVADLEEAALEAAGRGDAALALRLCAAMGRHTDRSNYSRFAAVTSLVSAYDGRLHDAVDAARGELRRLPPSTDRLTVLRVHQIAAFLLEGSFDPTDTIRSVAASVNDDPSAALQVAIEGVLLALEVGRIPEARELLRLLSEHQELLDEERGQAFRYLQKRLTPAVTAASLQGSADPPWSGLDDGAFTTGMLSGDLGQDVLFSGIGRHTDPAALPRVLRPAIEGPNSTLHRAMGSLLTAEIEAYRGDFAAAEGALRELDEVHAIESFAVHRRLAVELRIATATGSQLAPSVERALYAQGPWPIDLQHATLRTAHAAWMLSQGNDYDVDGQLRPAISATTGADANLALLGDPDLELVLPALFLGLCRRHGNVEEAAGYARDVVLARGRQSPQAAAAAQFASAVLATDASNPALAPPHVPELPLWVRDVMDRLWACELRPSPRTATATIDAAQAPADLAELFTPREVEVALLLKSGLRNKEISDALYLSVRSIEAAITSMFRKTGVSSRTALTAHLHEVEGASALGGHAVQDVAHQSS